MYVIFFEIYADSVKMSFICLSLHYSYVYLFVPSFRPEHTDRQRPFPLRHFDRNTLSVSGLSHSVISTGTHGASAECVKWRNLSRWIASQARNDGQHASSLRGGTTKQSRKNNKNYTMINNPPARCSASGVCAAEKSVPPNDNYYSYRFLHSAYSADAPYASVGMTESETFIMNNAGSQGRRK